MSNKSTPQDAIIAIHKKCLDCMGNSRKEVHRCKSKDCPLWQWREAENAHTQKRDKKQVTFFELLREAQ